MSVFKITFTNNRPISCSMIVEGFLKGEYTYEFSKDTLIHALINAHNQAEAMKISEEIAAMFLASKKATTL